MSSPVKQNNHSIIMEKRRLISMRSKEVTKAINKVFWNSESETEHSRYVGSYGRGTAINTSDLDILVELPITEYERFSQRNGNGQSQLLQAVKLAVASHYATTDMSGDGQVVVIKFSDGMRFEILPAFSNRLSTIPNQLYTYPTTNMGGNWLSTNPLAEQKAIKDKDEYWLANGLLKDTCKHIRYIRDDQFSSYSLSGILIDAFVFYAIGNWHWLREGEIRNPNQFSYEEVLLNQFKLHDQQFRNCMVPYLTVPGSGMVITIDKDWEILGKILNKMV